MSKVIWNEWQVLNDTLYLILIIDFGKFNSSEKIEKVFLVTIYRKFEKRRFMLFDLCNIAARFQT